MTPVKYVSYLRVSTARQGRSGLGLEAQRKAVTDHLNGSQGDLVAEYVEVESGKNNDRPKLAEALTLCRLHNATLLIAKLCRLSRDAHFLLGLQKAGVRFIAADMPSATELVVGVMALVAQEERRAISRRTKEALAAAAARGVRLGGDRGNLPAVARIGAKTSAAVRMDRANRRAADLAPIIIAIQETGASLNQIAADLNKRGIPAPRGAGWSAVQVKRVVTRVNNVMAVEGAPGAIRSSTAK